MHPFMCYIEEGGTVHGTICSQYMEHAWYSDLKSLNITLDFHIADTLSMRYLAFAISSNNYEWEVLHVQDKENNVPASVTIPSTYNGTVKFGVKLYDTPPTVGSILNVGFDYVITGGIDLSSYNVGDVITLDGIECVIIYKAEVQQSWGQYIVVDKNHDISYYLHGSDYADQSLPINDVKYGYEWGGYGTATGITSLAIGDGLSNTNSLIALNLQPNTSGWSVIWDMVEQFRASYSIKWFVPTKDELDLVYENRTNLSNLSLNVATNYWSSSEIASNLAYAEKFNGGNDYNALKKKDENRTRLCRYATDADLPIKDIHKIQMTCETDGATIMYTLDGTDPTENSTEYIAEIEVEPPVTIKARGYKEGQDASDIATLVLEGLPTAETPVITQDGNNITITSATSGASIYYTTDGTEPTTASTLYAGVFAITQDCTIKAIAVMDMYNNSEVATYSATFVPTLQTPTLSLSRSETTVSGTIGNTVTGATYVYKVGSAPASESDGTVISGTSFSFTDSSALTVYVRGFMTGYIMSDSVHASVGAYTAPKCATPQISQNGNTVSITCSTLGATIYYKLGITGSYQTYGSEFTISATTTVYAYATADGYTQSDEASLECEYVNYPDAGTKFPTPDVTVTAEWTDSTYTAKKLVFTWNNYDDYAIYKENPLANIEIQWDWGQGYNTFYGPVYELACKSDGVTTRVDEYVAFKVEDYNGIYVDSDVLQYTEAETQEILDALVDPRFPTFNVQAIAMMDMVIVRVTCDNAPSNATFSFSNVTTSVGNYPASGTLSQSEDNPNQWTTTLGPTIPTFTIPTGSLTVTGSASGYLNRTMTVSFTQST